MGRADVRPGCIIYDHLGDIFVMVLSVGKRTTSNFRTVRPVTILREEFIDTDWFVRVREPRDYTLLTG